MCRLQQGRFKRKSSKICPSAVLFILFFVKYTTLSTETPSFIFASLTLLWKYLYLSAKTPPQVKHLTGIIMICESIIYVYINFLESILLILNEKSVVIMYIMKYYKYIVFLALIVFISLAIGLLNPVYEGNEGNDSIYISYLQDIDVGKVFAVKYNAEVPDKNGHNDDIVFDYNTSGENSPIITYKGNIPLEIVNSYYHVSFIKDTDININKVFPVKGYYPKNTDNNDYDFDYGTNSVGADYTPDEKKQVTPTIAIKDGTVLGPELKIVNLNLSDTDKNTLYGEGTKYAMNDNSGERFKLPKEPIVDRYTTSTDDADGDSQYTVDENGVVSKNDAWNADTAFPDYNDSANLVAEKNANEKAQNKKMYVIGPSGERIEVPWTGSQTSINYNEPGYFRYQPSTFVPNYEDSVYLSRLTGYSTTKPVENTASKMGGFCEHHKYSPIKIEQECGKLEKDACASTSCCVLLGGSRCVGGNEKGPTMKANYGDITILNRDHYFYKGKCYGNCPH